MRQEHINQLIEAGENIGVKVTQDTIHTDLANIRDQQFKNFFRAAKYLQHIQATELPQSYLSLIG